MPEKSAEFQDGLDAAADLLTCHAVLFTKAITKIGDDPALHSLLKLISDYMQATAVTIRTLTPGEISVAQLQWIIDATCQALSQQTPPRSDNHGQ